jgi:hypothetical protein
MPSRGAGGPRDVLAEYARALQDGRVKDAYALLSDDAKKSMPFEAFTRMVKENPEDVRALSEALVRPSGPADVTATVTTPNGDVLLMRLEGGQWKIERSAIDLYAQDTPEAALRSFVRATAHGRYDILLRFVPDSKLDGLDAGKLKKAFEGEEREDVQRLTAAISAALPSATIERLGDRATMAYGGGGTIEMVREHGLWKIEEF